MALRILNEFAHGATAPAARVEADDPSVITDRQVDVLRYVVQGLTYKEIAAALSITERTVKDHMREIVQKLHLRNKSEVIAYALRTGLIDRKGGAD